VAEPVEATTIGDFFPKWAYLKPLMAKCFVKRRDCLLLYDIEGSLSLGNIENTSLETSLKSKKRKLIMKYPWLFERCRKCRGVLIFQKDKSAY